MADSSYDSRADIYEHIQHVQNWLFQMIRALLERLVEHDRSKLDGEEKECFDRVTPLLKGMTYGSDEYSATLREMKPALDLHYKKNRHHPEYGEGAEHWKQISGFEGYYEVSNLGDVRSVNRVVKRTGPTGDLRKQSQIIRPQVTPKGYLRLQLCKEGAQSNRLVHCIVAEAFISHTEEKDEVNHIDGIKSNNVVSNLEWTTASENQAHAYATKLKEPRVKYVVHCHDEDITTFGTQKMEHELKKRGYQKARASGIWKAMDTHGTHCGLTFHGTLLADWRRSRFAHMNLVDLIEMLCDWKAATLRHDDGDLIKSLKHNQERFGFGDEIGQLLLNTARDFRMVSRLDAPENSDK